MKRTVVAMQDTMEGDVNFYLYSPDNVPKADVLHALDCNPDARPFTDLVQGLLEPRVVRDVGHRLFEGLSQHEAVAFQMKAVLIEQVATAPIYFHLRSIEADDLPWEALCDSNGKFLALDERWPVARIIGALSAGTLERVFQPPLRIMAFLTATGVDARPEWNALYAPIRESGIEVFLDVYVCQPDLLADIQAINDPGIKIQVRLLPEDFDFANAIPSPDLAPHLLHFFCHGSTVEGPHLELSHVIDWENGTSSISITPDHFRRIKGFENHLWLVTLNCCEGAAAGPGDGQGQNQDAKSFARHLVDTYHFPAAVGMREAVDSADAHEFCKAFYMMVLQMIKASVEAGNTPTEVEWARALHEPRRRLVERHRNGKTAAKAAAITKEWTFPVLYVRPEVFSLRASRKNETLGGREREQLQVKITQLHAALNALPILAPDTPQSALDEIDAEISRLEAQLFA